MTKHIIELNGKRYDALTGRLLDGAASATPEESVATSAPALPKRQPRPSRANATANHRPKRAVQSSKTLMRRVVTKPTKKATPHVHTKQSPLPAKTANKSLVAPKRSINSIDPQRAKRSQQINRSKAVARFPAPKPEALRVTAKQPINLLDLSAKTPLAAAKAKPQPKPVTQVATKPAATSKTEKLFTDAIEAARSHETTSSKATKKRRGRTALNVIATFAAVLVIGGFVAYINRGTIELEIASVRAGFQASMPKYAPNGLMRQQVTAEGNAVKISFISPNSADRLTLTQQASDWDSQTLFDEVSNNSQIGYQTIQAGGRTVYVYDTTKATWVSGGILYAVEGNTPLDTNQITQLATSL